MKFMKKILFLCAIHSDNMVAFLSNHSLPTSSAGQTFGRALMTGLAKFCDLRVISEFFIPTFPKLKKIVVNRVDYILDKVQCKSISFLNVPLIKKLTQIISYLKTIWKSSKVADAIIVYEVTSRQLLPAVLAGRNTKRIVVVPDLPEFMSSNTNPLYLLAKKIDRLFIDWALKRMDGFVLLSPYMKEKLDIGDRPWIVVEGLFSPRDIVDQQDKAQAKVMLYTGKIEKWFGLEDLLEAFTRTKGDNYQLWLCGPGDIDMIRQYSKNDERIIYKGCLSHEEVLRLQKQATVLVNPRHSSDEFILYSFPSKTMEYMASGTPTLMSRLKSLPEDYLTHLFLFEDESIDGMSKMIKKCLDMDPVLLSDFGKKASDFILLNKTAEKQAQRIVEMLL